MPCAYLEKEFLQIKKNKKNTEELILTSAACRHRSPGRVSPQFELWFIGRKSFSKSRKSYPSSHSSVIYTKSSWVCTCLFRKTWYSSALVSHPTCSTKKKSFISKRLGIVLVELAQKSGQIYIITLILSIYNIFSTSYAFLSMNIL